MQWVWLGSIKRFKYYLLRGATEVSKPWLNKSADFYGKANQVVFIMNIGNKGIRKCIPLNGEHCVCIYWIFYLLLRWISVAKTFCKTNNFVVLKEVCFLGGPLFMWWNKGMFERLSAQYVTVCAPFRFVTQILTRTESEIACTRLNRSSKQWKFFLFVTRLFYFNVTISNHENFSFQSDTK